MTFVAAHTARSRVENAHHREAVSGTEILLILVLLHLNFCIGAPGRQIQVCKEVYAQAHKRGKTFINEVIRECKNGIVSTAQPMNVRTVVPPDVLKSLSRVGNENGFKLSKQDKANACMVDDPVTLACAAWMTDHFSLCGDHAPNREEEIQLEPVHKIRIYMEYKRDQEQLEFPLPFISLKQFYGLWEKCFDHVKLK